MFFRRCQDHVLKPPLTGSGYSGYPPGMVPGMRKRGITRHSGCFLTVVVMYKLKKDLSAVLSSGMAGFSRCVSISKPEKCPNKPKSVRYSCPSVVPSLNTLHTTHHTPHTTPRVFGSSPLPNELNGGLHFAMALYSRTRDGRCVPCNIKKGGGTCPLHY